MVMPRSRSRSMAVEHLGLHLARGQRAGQLQQAVSQRGFAMIDMGNDGKIPKKSSVHGCSGQSLILTGGRQAPDLRPQSPAHRCFAEG